MPLRHNIPAGEQGDARQEVARPCRRLVGDRSDEVVGCETIRIPQSKAEVGAEVLLARNMRTSVKYIEEHYGHVDIDVMRKELTRERRKADHAMRVIME